MKRKTQVRRPLTDAERDAAGAVYLDALRYVKVLAKRRGWPHIDDLESLVGMGVVIAARTYDPSRGMAMKSWAIRRAVGSVLTSFRPPTYKRPRPSVLPLDGHDPAETVSADTTQAETRFDRLVSLAPPRTRDVLRVLYRDGGTTRTAAERLGCASQTVLNRKREALDDLRRNPETRRSA